MNLVQDLFKDFNEKGIRYCVRGRFKHLPNTLDGGDIDILIEKKSWEKAEMLIKKKEFLFYPFTEPNKFFFRFDKDLGLIHLDILLSSNFPNVKKFKSFYIPENEQRIENKKKLPMKAYTALRRRLHFAFNGPLFVFEGPDGSGKTTNAKALLNSLENFPLKTEFVHFATPFNKDGSKPSRFKRLYTRLLSLLKVWKNVVLGRITITDRYIYLTFRNSSPLLKKLLRAFSPKPSILFITRSDIKTIQKRKKGQRDFLSSEKVKELYDVYDSINAYKKDIQTRKDVKENIEDIVNQSLRKIL